MRPQRFKTRITELFGIRHPIVAGGLMWLADANYVAAVVNAGGMGFITAKTFPEEGRFEAELDKAATLTGGKPFGVNLYMSNRPEQNKDLPAQLEVALDKGVRHFETAGLPPTEFVERIKDAGGVVFHKVATVKHAISAVSKLPIDAVAVVGAECGGHPGLNLIGSIVQIPLAVQRLEVPVLVGGGIGTGSQIAAALAMGADAVLLGTRFLVATEIWSHDLIKQRVVDAQETDTALVLASLRNTFRGIDNATTRAIADLEKQGVTAFDAYRPYVMGTLQKEAYTVGDPEKGILSMGQACVFADKIEPVEAIMDRLVDEAVAASGRLGGLMAADAESAAAE
ncbi:nitronate monooxygenase [Thalassobaculum sp.]|uniref:NAD(P)H-dependent flavin oxidoreductase n=1 Tax=Thalassobaculum sp. TaxID=2022740 RepID=UPI0032EBD918